MIMSEFGGFSDREIKVVQTRGKGKGRGAHPVIDAQTPGGSVNFKAASIRSPGNQKGVLVSRNHGTTRREGQNATALPIEAYLVKSSPVQATNDQKEPPPRPIPATNYQKEPLPRPNLITSDQKEPPRPLEQTMNDQKEPLRIEDEEQTIGTTFGDTEQDNETTGSTEHGRTAQVFKEADW